MRIGNTFVGNYGHWKKLFSNNYNFCAHWNNPWEPNCGMEYTTVGSVQYGIDFKYG